MFLIIKQPLGPFRQEETLKYLLISRRYFIRSGNH